jgi:predicted RNase H-like HicB family nuclease
MAHGTTYEEALTNIEDAMILWLDTARDDGIAVPEPRQYAAVG